MGCTHSCHPPPSPNLPKMSHSPFIRPPLKLQLKSPNKLDKGPPAMYIGECMEYVPLTSQQFIRDYDTDPDALFRELMCMNESLDELDGLIVV